MKSALLLILLIPVFSFSQDFRRGYVITSNGDTITGLVKYQKGRKAYRTCTFKKSEAEAIIKYNPSQINGYGIIDDSFFESRTVKTMAGASEIVFIEVILKGFGSLYKFDGSYWIDKQGEPDLARLQNEFKEVYVGENLVRKKTNQYVSTLTLQLSDCEGLRPSIQKVTLNERPLSRLISDYNKCKGYKVKTFNDKPWVKPKLGLAGGFNDSQFNFTADNNNTYNSVANGVTFQQISGNYSGSSTPTFGVTLNLLLPRHSEHFSFVSGVSYLSTKYTNVTPATGFNGGTNYVKIDVQQLKVPVGVRYTVTNENSGIFVNAGYLATVHLHADFRWNQANQGNSVNYDNRLKIKGNQAAFWAGFGFERQVAAKLIASLEFRYEITNGIVPNTSYGHHLDTSITNLQVIFGIRMK